MNKQCLAWQWEILAWRAAGKPCVYVYRIAVTELLLLIVFEISMFDYEVDEVSVNGIGFGVMWIVFGTPICWNRLICFKVDSDMIATIHTDDMLSWRICKSDQINDIDVPLTMSMRWADLRRGNSANSRPPSRVGANGRGWSQVRGLPALVI